MTHLGPDLLLDLSLGTDDHPHLDLSLGTDDHPHLGACPDCRAALDATREALHLLALGAPPIAPPPSLRVRLLAAVAGPLAPRSARVAAFLDLPHPGIAATLADIDAGTAAWTPVLPGIDRLPLVAGPRERGLLRAAAATVFPHHRHLGDEHVLVLQGSCRDSNGRQLAPGDEIHHTENTAHHLEIHPGPALVFAYISDGSDFTPAESSIPT